MNSTALAQKSGTSVGVVSCERSWKSHRLLTCDGSFDTEIKTGADYRTLSLGDVFGQLEPAAQTKKRAPAILCSSYAAFDARSHAAQVRRGRFVAIPGDIDKGDTSLETVSALVAQFFGEDVARLIYSTASSEPSSRRWRTLVPLAEPVPFDQWTLICQAFNRHMAAHGCHMDTSLERAGQIAYLPNVPPERRKHDGTPKYFVIDAKDGRGAGLDAGMVASGVAAVVQELEQQEKAKQQAQAEAREARRRRVEARGATHEGSVIDAWNEKHDVVDVMLQHGYEQSPVSDVDWRSVYQSSGSYATRVVDGACWVSLSASDAAAKLGSESKSGARFGDAFDLYVHFDHGGDFVAAVRAAANELGLLLTSKVGPTYADIINTLEGAALVIAEPVEFVEHAMAAIVPAVGLTPAELENVLQRLKALTGLSIKVLRQELATARCKGPEDDFDAVSVDWPVPTARAFLGRSYVSPAGHPTLRHWQDEFLAWTGSRYRSISVADIRSKVYKLFEQEGVALPGRGVVDNVVDAVKALSNVPSSVNMPDWLASPAPVPVNEVVPVRNGLLHLRTGRLIPHDARFFSSEAAEVDFCADAPVPAAWLKFLSDAFPDDQEAIDALQQWFGYLLTSDTSQQKGLICVGPKRCGKGTIARVLRGLIGEHNFVGPTLGQLSTQFGLQGLINATVAVISDARIGGAADLQGISENLLRITGEDAISVPRKGIADWVGRLRTRFVIMTNVLPGIVDGGGAIASRFIVVKFNQSFYGREDTRLTEKLLAELPGILNWALAGLAKLQSRGAFIQPASGLSAVDELRRRTTPILGFIEDVLELEDAASAWVSKDRLYSAYKQWASEEGMRYPLTRNHFFTELYSNSDGRLTPHEPRCKKDGSGKDIRVKAVKGARLVAVWDDKLMDSADPKEAADSVVVTNSSELV